MIVVAAVVLGFVLLGGADTPLAGPDTPPTPHFAFERTKVVAVPTRANAEAGKLTTRAKPAADEVAKVMDALYVGAFLDSGNWQDGSYGDVWDLFDQGASAEAQQQVDTLTAGTGAGEAFDTIVPDAGVLKTKVLFDQRDQPFSIVAIVRFEATAGGKDGPDLRLNSAGQFVFQKVDGTWKVVSFRVLRNDVPEPAATATPSESPS